MFFPIENIQITIENFEQFHAIEAANPNLFEKSGTVLPEEKYALKLNQEQF